MHMRQMADLYGLAHTADGNSITFTKIPCVVLSPSHTQTDTHTHTLALEHKVSLCIEVARATCSAHTHM